MKNKEDQQTQFRINDGNKYHLFVVGAGFECEAGAWKDIVIRQRGKPRNLSARMKALWC